MQSGWVREGQVIHSATPARPEQAGRKPAGHKLANRCLALVPKKTAQIKTCRDSCDFSRPREPSHFLKALTARLPGSSLSQNSSPTGESDLEEARAVTKRRTLDARLLQHGQPQIGQGRFLGVDNVTVAHYTQFVASQDGNGKIIVVMAVAIRITRAIGDEAMIQQRAFPLTDSSQLGA